jgi:hypothetical protein
LSLPLARGALIVSVAHRVGLGLSAARVWPGVQGRANLASWGATHSRLVLGVPIWCCVPIDVVWLFLAHFRSFFRISWRLYIYISVERV